jgi:PAS domain S-box-containing protein
LKLIQFTRGFQNGSLDATIDIPSYDEVGLLVESYREMAVSIDRLVSRLQDEIVNTKHSEELLKQSGHKVKLLLEAAGEGIMGLDADGNYTFVNQMGCDLLGYGVEELLGRNSHTLVHHSYPEGSAYPDEACPIYETLSDGKSHYGEEYFWKKDGTVFPTAFSSLPIIENERITGAVITFSDITEQKKYEKLTNVLFDISQTVTKSADMYSLYEHIHEIIKQLMTARNFYIGLYDPESDLITYDYFIDEHDEAGEPVHPGRGCTEYVLRTGESIVIDSEIMKELGDRGEIELVGVQSPVWLGVPLKIADSIIGVMAVQDYENEFAYGEDERMILVFVSEQIA